MEWFRVYGEENVKNITLAQQEMNVLKKLSEIRRKMIKKSKINEIESIKVNPFLTMMYYKSSFRAWRRKTRKNEILRRNGQDPDKVEDDSDDDDSMRSEYTYKVEIVESDEEEKKGVSIDSQMFKSST